MEDFFEEYGEVIVMVILSSFVILMLSWLYTTYIGG